MGGPTSGDPGERRFRTREELIAFAIEALHSDRARESAAAIAKFTGIDLGGAELKPEQVSQINFSLVQWALDNDRYYDAAALLWPKTLFNPEPISTRQVWDTWESSGQFLLQGAASMSKSFSVGVRLLLEWVRDPEYTTIKVLGPSEDHLQNNLFSHLVELHQNASMKLPGLVQSLFIGINTRARRGSISGVVVPLGRKSAAKLQGSKRFPRKVPHPVFGERSRMFVFMDEVNKIPPGIWTDVDNLLANSETDVRGFKVGGAFNPQDQGDAVGVRAEPEFGWEEFDLDVHYSWKSKRGWDVLRLDALKCENIVQDRVVYPGLQTKEGMDKIIRNSGGYNTPGYFSMVRAAYPPKGQAFSVIAQGLVNTAKAEVLWASSPIPCAGGDVALEGIDRACMALGEWGLARGLRLPASSLFPEGQEILFSRKGIAAFKHILLLKKLVELPSGDTVVMSNQIRDFCRRAGVRPEWLCVDRTGNGAGVHDHLKSYWSSLVKGVNFFEAASNKKIFVEDEKTPHEEYARAVSEMWFATAKFLEFDYLKFDPDLDISKLGGQLCGRLFVPGPTAKVESKKDYTSRGNESPHEADAVVLLVHGVRMESDQRLTMNPEPGEAPAEADGAEGDFFFVDPTNLYDHSL